MFDDMNSINNNKCKPIDNMFTTLHAFQEIDAFLDKGKEYFSKKYNIDYFSVHMVHHTRSCLVGFYAHDEWHDFLYRTKQGLSQYQKNLYATKNATIKKNEFYLEYFDSFHNSREANERAEIVGVRKYGGCNILVSDDMNNITVYDITFKDDSAFGTLDKKVLYELTKDLIRYKSLLLPFINHANQFNDFSDKKTLHQSMDKFMQENSSLFHF